MASAIIPLVDCCLEEYRSALKKCLFDQKLFAMPEPRLTLLPDGELARLNHPTFMEDDVKEEGQIDDDDDDEAEQEGPEQVKKLLSLQDMQAFLVALLLPEPRLSAPPKWCRVLRCMRACNVGIFFIVDNGDLEWLDKSPFKFNHIFKFQTAPDWIEVLINIPLSRRQQTKSTSLNEQSNNYQLDYSANLEETIPRTSLLLSPIQMITEGFPIPGTNNYPGQKKNLSNNTLNTADQITNITFTSSQSIFTDLDDDVVHFRSKFNEVTDISPMFSIDCEMCLTDAKKSELTRISIVDEEYNVVYDSFVKPPNYIVDYLTKYSGITKEILDPVDTTLEDVLAKIRKFLPRHAIICGHSLNNDLQALNVFHPYVIDTSIIYNLTGCRPLKPSLKSLAYTFLGREIQTNRKKGHDSVEDANTAMELVKLKLANGLSFGDQVVKDIELGVKYDARTGTAHMPINKFVSRHNTKLAFCEIDQSPNARYLYIHDDEQPVGDQIKESIEKLIETKSAICVVLTSTGSCYVKF